MKNLRHLTRTSLEDIIRSQEKTIAHLKLNSNFMDIVRLVEQKEKLMEDLALWQNHAHDLYIRLQQNRLYLGDMDIVEFYKSIENTPQIHENNRTLLDYHVDNVE